MLAHHGNVVRISRIPSFLRRATMPLRRQCPNPFNDFGTAFYSQFASLPRHMQRIDGPFDWFVVNVRSLSLLDRQRPICVVTVESRFHARRLARRVAVTKWEFLAFRLEHSSVTSGIGTGTSAR